MTYPYPYSTLEGTDATGFHEFAASQEVVEMATAMKDRLCDLIAGGSELKRDIYNAADQAALDAIVDSPT